MIPLGAHFGAFPTAPAEHRTTERLAALGKLAASKNGQPESYLLR